MRVVSFTDAEIEEEVLHDITRLQLVAAQVGQGAEMTVVGFLIAAIVVEAILLIALWH